MPIPVVILGIGGNCVDILDTILDINRSARRQRYECIGFLDDNPAVNGTRIHGIAVLGPLAGARRLRRARFVNGIGSPRNFRRKQAVIAQTGLSADRFVTLVHPTASVSGFSALGRGVVLLQHVTVASGAKVGDHVIILPSSTVSHDAVVGDYACIAGGVCVSGGVTIGNSCYLGTNCSIIGNVAIGEYSMIGMGSVVLKDIPPRSTFAGNPARALRKGARSSRPSRR